MYLQKGFTKNLMTPKKSLSQQIIFYLILLGLVFSCAKDKNFSGKNSAPYSYRPQPYQPYYQPYSRVYNNPYVIPSQNYQPHYDFDQYYVPHSKYQNVEQNSSGIDDKF